MAQKKSFEELLKAICLNPLSEGFVMAKPVQQDSGKQEAVIRWLEEKSQLIITRKRDGWKTYNINAGGEIKIYTDKPRDITDCLPHLNKELGSLRLPPKTFLVSEGLMMVGNKDNRGKVPGVLSASKEKTVENQKKFGPMSLMVFDIAFWGGEYLLNKPYSHRLGLIQKILRKTKCQHISSPEVLDMSFAEAQKVVAKQDWEGLVLYDTNFTSSFRLDGKDPERPTGCYKWKPIKEDDFIAYDWKISDKIAGQLKEVLIAQIDPETKTLFDCGKFGGFDTAIRERLKNMDYPFVVQLQFVARTESGKLQEARFVSLREDKKTDNCIAPKHFEKSTPIS